jgi:hypothetical protein
MRAVAVLMDDQMNRGLIVAISLTLVIGIVCITVHPFVDLDPTVLRLLQTSVLFFALLVLARTLIGRRLEILCDRISANSVDSPRRNTLQLIDFNCARLC